VGGSMTSARWLWARREIAQRWRSLVAVGLLAGIAGGLSLAAIAGARRSQTAYSRNRVATAAPDAIVFGTQVGAEDVDYSRVLKLPEVVDGGTFELAGITVTNIDGIGKVEPGALGALAPGDTHLYRTLSRPLLRQGRLPDPTRDDEIVVNRLAARKFHLHLGQHVEVLGARNLDAFYGAPIVVGVKIRSTIVGIGDSLMDDLFNPDQPAFEPSGAFMVRHGSVVGHAPNLLVRLKPGTNVDAFHQRAVQLLSDPHVDHAALLNVPVRDLGDDAKRVTHATDLETTGLLLFAAAVAFAALVLIGQTISRLVYAMAASVPALRSLGFTRRDLIRALVAPFVVAVPVATAGAVLFAIGFSRSFPVGLARRFDPDLGLHADWKVLIPGALAVVVFVVAGAVVGCLRATSARLQSAPVRRSPYRRRLLSSAPLSVSLGVGMALDTGKGERALPVRPAITGTIAAIIGIVGAFGLVHGINDALDHPARSGQVYDAIVTPGSEAEFHAFPRRLALLPQVGEIAHIRHGTAAVAGAGLPLWDIEPIKGHMHFTMLDGPAPGDGQAAVGPSTLRALHLHVGDDIRIAGPKPATLRISGTALLPESPHSSFDQGLWVSPRTMRDLFDTPERSTTTDEEFAVTRRQGTTPKAFEAAVTSVTKDVDPVAVPQDVVFLRDVRSLPVALAIFLILLAIAAVGHALVTAVGRRRHDFAILRAVGFRPRQSAACIAALAGTVSLVGIAIGVPLGIVAGRLSWRWVATRTPLLYTAPIATAVVLLCIPATLLLANVLAALPARRAARIPTAEVLRVE
jgi:hypothetical protein